MRQMISSLRALLYKLLRSRAFFIVVVILFVVQAAWLAVSARSLPYDEYYHMGIIELYSQQWSPIIQEQSADAALYGDVSRLPSYLYHYLMSFPYRFVGLFTESLVAKTIVLRFFSIGMVVAAIFVFRRFCRLAKVNRGICNMATLLFTSTPIVVVLSAHVSYDTLSLLLSMLLLHLAYRLYTRPPTISTMAVFVSLGLLGSVVKHLSLAIFGILLAIIAVRIVRRYGTGVIAVVQKDYLRYTKLQLGLLGLLLVLATGFFVERHVVNFVDYGTVNIKCDAVQSRTVCWRYSPWRRNEIARQQSVPRKHPTMLHYFSAEWVPRMANGPFDIYTNIPLNPATSEDPYGHYVGKSKIWLYPALAYILGIAGIIAMALTWKKLRGDPLSQLLLMTIVATTAAVFITNYGAYTRLGQPYAIQPRYLLPLYLPALVLILMSANSVLQKVFRKNKIFIALLVMGLFWYGGGVAGWIIRADADWFWPNDRLTSFNKQLQTIGQRIIPH